MKRRIWTVGVGLAALAALVAVPAAMAAYNSPKLEVTQTATGVVVKASLDPNDDPTAAVVIAAPTGTQLTTNQAPGTVLGPVRAVVKALDLAGADLPLEGQLVVAAPGQVPAATADRMHRGRDATRDVGHGARGSRADAVRPDLSRADRGHALRRARAGLHRDLPASARRPGRNARSRDVRREGVQRRARDQAASSARSRPARGSPRGCRTRPEQASRTRRAPSCHRRRSHRVR